MGAHMNTIKRVSLFSLVTIFVLFSLTSCQKKQGENDSLDVSAYEWITIDEFYVPADYIEEYIKNDSEEKAVSPRNQSVLRSF